MARRSRRGRRLHGILLLDKATGQSSNHALQQVKRLFDAQKAGHTGSLDPLATGMLPVCFGEATKISSFLLDADKVYETDARLGVRTDSGDADGEVIATAALPPGLDMTLVEETVRRHTGELEQIPPMYSAIRVNGQRLYKLAREGLSVERQARRITVFSIDILQWQSDLLRLRVHCSKGTYIRTLVEDIGQALGCGAHVEALRRITVGPFNPGNMITATTLAGWQEEGDMNRMESVLQPTDSALQAMPAVALCSAGAAGFCQGQRVAVSGTSIAQRPEGIPANAEACYRVYSRDQFLGVARMISDATGQLQIQPYRVFNW